MDFLFLFLNPYFDECNNSTLKKGQMDVRDNMFTAESYNPGCVWQF